MDISSVQIASGNHNRKCFFDRLLRQDGNVYFLLLKPFVLALSYIPFSFCVFYKISRNFIYAGFWETNYTYSPSRIYNRCLLYTSDAADEL